jgi:hypothetical protein
MCIWRAGLVGEKGPKGPISFFISGDCVYIWWIYNSMRHVKLFEDFSSQEALTEEQIEWLDKCATRGWKLNSSTGLVDVDGDFNCVQQDLTDFKGVRFGHVNGYFYCHDNELTSLVGAPQTVGVSFYCHNNQLTSLEGAPQTVGGVFYCNNNQLTSLEGAPQKVGWDFYCTNNPVSEKTLASIFALMKNGKSYQQALEECWPDMDDADRALMYKDHSSLTPEEIRRYEALATVNRIKNYL